MANKTRTFVFSKMFFKSISSKKYSTVFDVFRFIVKLRSSVLTSTWNDSIRVIQKGLRARRPPETVCNKMTLLSGHHKKTSLYQDWCITMSCMVVVHSVFEFSIENTLLLLISSKIMGNMVWDHPGGSRGRLGDHFGPRTAQGSKRAPKSRESVLRFWPKWRPGPTFRGLVFYCFWRCSCFRFFKILGAQRHNFGFRFGCTLRAMGPWENS